MAAVGQREWKWNLNVKLGSVNENNVKVMAWDAGDTQVVSATTGFALSAAISEDNAVFTNETTDANNDTANDVTLLPTPAASTDRFYIGYSAAFSRVEINVGTAGAGTYTLAWTYYDGSTWASLTVDDDTTDFKASGRNVVSFTAPANWATTTVNAQGPFYYIRCTRDAGTQTTQPLGTRLYINPGDIAEQEMQEATYSITGTSTVATTEKTPHTLSLVKYGNKPLPLTVSFLAGRRDTFFQTVDSYITESDKATVAAYTGITITHASDSTSQTVSHTFAEIYDYHQNEAYDSPQVDYPGGVMTTADGNNHPYEYDYTVSGVGIVLTGQSKTITFAAGKDMTFAGGAKATALTIGGDLNVGNTAIDMTGVNVTGTEYFTTAGTYNLTDCVIDTVSSTISGVILNLLGTSSVDTNATPANITINNAVTLQITVRDKATNALLPNIRCSIYKESDNTELMNEDTNALGVASESYNFLSTTAIYWRVRESPEGGDRYKAESGVGEITSGGYSNVVLLRPETVQ